ncbi:hypothetical protein NQ257_25505, partial [Escherichia coli]|nr:hypothetical protein [Escherichia coli]
IGAAGGVAHRTAPAGEWVGDGGLRAVVATSVDDELDEIARTLRERRLRDGVPWGELAVIAHDTRQVQALEAGLAAREVPTRGQGQGVPLGQVP